MRITLRVVQKGSDAPGADVAADGPDYDTAVASARTRIPEGFLVAAILVDRASPLPEGGR
jgi:hypothetical protein